MGFTPTEKIWFNGKLVAWGDAKVHVLTHALQYGTGVFEGMRCYATPEGPAVFRRRVAAHPFEQDRKSTRLNSSHVSISYAVFCLKKKKKRNIHKTNQSPVKQ